MTYRPTASPRHKPTASVRERVARSPSRRATSTPARREVEIARAVESWLRDGEAQRWSPVVLYDRRKTLERFQWWLEHIAQQPAHLSSLAPDLLREFLAYAGAACPEGRYGSDRASTKRAARPATVHAAFRILRAFTNFCLAEGLLTETPLKNVRPPRIPKDQIQPFTEAQIQTLLNQVRGGLTPERDTALIYLLLDTGMRVSELCSLVMGDINRGSGLLRVVGKGDKERSVFMGVKARRALWRHLEVNRRNADDRAPVFCGFRGHTPGAALTESGVGKVIHKAGVASGIQQVRCSPHTFRHTFAINFLRNGGDLFELQEVMGHEDPSVLRRYVKLAEQDLAEAHRSASPADRMKLR